MILDLYRRVSFILVLILSLSVLGLSAHILSATEADSLDLFGYVIYYVFSALGVAVAVLSLVTIGPMLVFDLVSPGLFTSRVWFELVVLSILWVLWLATAAETIQTINDVGFGSCGAVLYIFRSTCNEFAAVAALSFLAWITLLAYTITLLVLAFRASQAGNRAWTTTVREGFSAHDAALARKHDSSHPQPSTVLGEGYPMYETGHAQAAAPDYGNAANQAGPGAYTTQAPAVGAYEEPAPSGPQHVGYQPTAYDTA